MLTCKLGLLGPVLVGKVIFDELSLLGRAQRYVCLRNLYLFFLFILKAKERVSRLDEERVSLSPLASLRFWLLWLVQSLLFAQLSPGVGEDWRDRFFLRVAVSKMSLVLQQLFRFGFFGWI